MASATSSIFPKAYYPVAHAGGNNGASFRAMARHAEFLLKKTTPVNDQNRVQAQTIFDDLQKLEKDLRTAAKPLSLEASEGLEKIKGHIKPLQDKYNVGSGLLRTAVSYAVPLIAGTLAVATAYFLVANEAGHINHNKFLPAPQNETVLVNATNPSTNVTSLFNATRLVIPNGFGTTVSGALNATSSVAAAGFAAAGGMSMLSIVTTAAAAFAAYKLYNWAESRYFSK